VHTHVARLLGGALFAALLAMLLGPTPAFADEVPGGVANFPQAGARVYPIDAVSLGCRLFGSCAGVATGIDDRAVPQYLSLHAGEGVGAECTLPGLVRVRYFADAELTDGWAFASDVRLRHPLDEC